MDNIVVEMLKQIKESKMNIGDLSNDIDIITALSINGKIVGYSIINKSKSPIKVFTLKDNAYILQTLEPQDTVYLPIDLVWLLSSRACYGFKIGEYRISKNVQLPVTKEEIGYIDMKNNSIKYFNKNYEKIFKNVIKLKSNNTECSNKAAQVIRGILCNKISV